MEEPQKPTGAPESPSEPTEASQQPAQPAQPTDGPALQPQQPGGPLQPPAQADNGSSPQQTAWEQSELNTARTLATIATIGGPVSFIIGGVALSTAAVVCAIIAYTKVNKVLRNTASPMYAYAKVLKQTAFMGLFIGAVALILNFVGMMTMMPKIMEAMQTGDYSSILGTGSTGGQATAPSSGGESAWG